MLMDITCYFTQQALNFGPLSEEYKADEVKKAAADREVMLADVKKRNEEYKAQRAAGNVGSATTTAQPTATVNAGGFTF